MAAKRKAPVIPTTHAGSLDLDENGIVPARPGLSPIERMVHASVRCTICGAKGVGTCDCWRPCPCGWTRQKGKRCRNPAHRRVGADAAKAKGGGT